MLFMCKPSIVLYSEDAGVKRVEVDLSGLSCRSFCIVQLCISWRYGCMLYVVLCCVYVCVR